MGRASNTRLRRELGQAIAEARRRAGLTQAELAERLGITQGMVSQYERGDAMPGDDLLDAIERELGVSVHIVAEHAAQK